MHQDNLTPSSLEGEETGNLSQTQDEFASMIEQFRPSLASRARYLFRLNRFPNSFSPEDLLQETYCRAFSSRSKFRGTSDLELCGWLLAIMRNVASDQSRRTSLFHAYSTFFGFCSDDKTPSHEMLSAEREALLHTCLSKLSPEQSQVISMRHFEGLKFKELASRMNQNINTVVGWYRRGLLKLEMLLSQLDPENYGNTYGGDAAGTFQGGLEFTPVNPLSESQALI